MKRIRIKIMYKEYKIREWMLLNPSLSTIGICIPYCFLEVICYGR